ncbi:histidine kinase [Spongiibacter sp. KMU-158]|uniref:histidine kinase n=1 Tax=Spongiibacter pelagi TaxID=2760804 RepID=A0A927C440_9GAMM|nr:ATP-binding protein [Spongiibacter pelagi]MBD2859105.1 histidine kinase [Spongiibacter pelagi]
MSDFMKTFLGNQMPPHGHCYLWNDHLVYLHVISDSLISLAYFTIPIALVYLIRRRDDLQFNYIFQMFGLFIFACGLTHVINIYNVWYGAYWFSGTVKAITAAASVMTAIMIWPLMPKVLAIPSNTRLRELNEDLRQKSEQNALQRQELENVSLKLAELVNERTAELEEIRRIRSQLEKNNVELSRSNEAFQQFGYITSHDLKEPLRTISSMGQMLKQLSAEKLDDKERKMLDYMVDSSVRMSSLIDDLHSYTVVGHSQDALSEENLDDIVQTLLTDLSVKIEESGAKISVAPLGRAKVIKPQFQQLMQNMIGNAIKFSAAGRAPQIEIGRLNDSETELGIFVRDNGIGIPKAYHQKIFGMFQRLHKRGEYEGTGMGLAISKKIVDNHGGRVEVNSQEGEGTEFRIFLPK